MIARRHMHQFGTTREHLAAVAVKNHATARSIPTPHMRKVITMEQALKARNIAEPLTLYDCSLVSDGAAAVILSARPPVPKRRLVLGIAQTSDHVALDDKSDITTFPAVRAAAEKAYAHGRRCRPPTSISPKCTTASPSPRSSRLEDLGFVAAGRVAVRQLRR